MAAGRATSLLMAMVGLLLVGLMVYALTLGTGGIPSLGRAPEARSVAVYFPDTSSWQEFRRALVEVAGRGLAEVVERTAGMVRLRCRRTKREIAFHWYDEPGLLAARTSLRGLLESENPPIAVIGSTNTALTAALAQELADAGRTARRDRPAPFLLMPAASGVSVPRVSGTTQGEGGDARGMEPLLGIYPRSLRFCLNNQRMADLVVGVARSLDAAVPRRAVLVVDPNDPFSVDLANCFSSSLEQIAPRLDVTRYHWTPSPGRAFGTLEGELKEMLGPLEMEAGASPGVRDWLILTIQGSPARQLLQTLRGVSGAGHLRVVAGDGIGRSTLQSFAGQLPFPLCAASSVSTEVPDWLVSQQGQVGQVQAELAAALLAVFGSVPGDHDLFPGLVALNWRPDSENSVGRSLVFEDRDRAGGDVGQVLEIRPGSSIVLGHQPVAASPAAAGVDAGSGTPSAGVTVGSRR